MSPKTFRRKTIEHVPSKKCARLGYDNVQRPSTDTPWRWSVSCVQRVRLAVLPGTPALARVAWPKKKGSRFVWNLEEKKGLGGGRRPANGILTTRLGYSRAFFLMIVTYQIFRTVPTRLPFITVVISASGSSVTHWSIDRSIWNRLFMLRRSKDYYTVCIGF